MQLGPDLLGNEYPNRLWCTARAEDRFLLSRWEKIVHGDASPLPTDADFHAIAAEFHHLVRCQIVEIAAIEEVTD